MADEGWLDSWKEIASYMGRDERTVQRWESERNLPVRRLPGGKRGGVYAYRQELDAWRTSGQGAEPQEEIVHASERATDLLQDQRSVSSNGNGTATIEQGSFTNAAGAAIARGAAEDSTHIPAASSLWIAHQARSFITAMILALVLAGLGFLAGARLTTLPSSHMSKLVIQRLTFRHGSIRAARFRPDGRNV